MNSQHNRSIKHTLKRHVHKLNEIFFWTDSFEQQCVLLYSLLNQGEISSDCSFISMNNAYFNSHFIPNSKLLFSETSSPKNNGQVSFDKKGYQYAVLVSFTATPHVIITDTHTGKTFLIHRQVIENVFPQNYVHRLVLLTGKFVVLE